MHVEARLRAVFTLLFAVAGLVPPGDVLDAGVNNGQDTEYLARLDPTRTVVSMEPLRPHHRTISAMSRRVANIRPIRGALGATARTESYPIELERRREQLNEQTRQQAGSGARVIRAPDVMCSHVTSEASVHRATARRCTTRPQASESRSK